MTVSLFGLLRASAAATAAPLLVAPIAFAHGGETSFSIEPSVATPGSGVGVRADLLTSGPVRLVLAGIDGSRREVALVEETVEGHFEAVIEIPGDLAPGTWTLLAEADGTVYGAATLEVAGSDAGAESGEQGPRDEDDTLLQPLPSGWQASRSKDPALIEPNLTAKSGTIDPVPFVAAGLAVFALFTLVRRTRRSHPGR